MNTEHRTFRVNSDDWGKFCTAVASKRGPGQTARVLREFIQAYIDGRVKQDKAEVVKRQEVEIFEISSSPNM